MPMLIGTILAHYRSATRPRNLSRCRIMLARVRTAPDLAAHSSTLRRNMTTPAPTPAPAAPASAPGKILGIVGLILAIVWPFQVIGLILSIVARVQSKAAGLKNTPATAGIIIAIIVIVGSILFFAVGGVALFSQCASLGTGVHDVNGVTVTCG
jgi:hypothetical protein